MTVTPEPHNREGVTTSRTYSRHSEEVNGLDLPTTAIKTNFLHLAGDSVAVIADAFYVIKDCLCTVFLAKSVRKY